MVASRQGQEMLGLFVSRRRELVAYARAIIGDQGLAEDIVQDAYIRLDRAEKSRPEGETLEGPVGYLFRVVRNLAIDRRRKLGRESSYMIPGEAADTARIAGDQPSPETTVIARDELRRLNAALAELPERSRIALEMYRLGGYRFTEIAAYLGVSVGTAHSLVVNALAHCRRRVHDGK